MRPIVDKFKKIIKLSFNDSSIFFGNNRILIVSQPHLSTEVMLESASITDRVLATSTC